MTPKDKAKQIMFLFADKIQKYDTILYQKKLSKKCALILIDEILDAIVKMPETYDKIKYWQEVKQEIETP